MNGVAAAASAIALSLLTLPAQASDARAHVWTTPGWAGYVARDGAEEFTSVSGSWVQPRVVCNRPGSAVSFWIGLGGTRSDSASLEQVGTSADCDDRGVLSLSAWYELFPAPPVDVPVRVHAGDLFTASVSVTGPRVTVTFADRTTGKTFSRTARMIQPSTDSAEWIAEAPSACFASCATLPLAGFAKVHFLDAHADVAGHDGSIDDTAWTSLRLEMKAVRTGELSPDGSRFDVRRALH